MSGFLDMAMQQARERVAAAEASEPLVALRRRALDTPEPVSFADALRRSGVSVITEIKRASPSRGHLADIPDPAALAVQYARGGAHAISVLTEPQHFNGSLDDLTAVVGAVDLPVLRKDFTVAPYQVWEARAAGASAVLLIVAGLDADQLLALLQAASEAGLDALIETHDEPEIIAAREAWLCVADQPLIVGVNARDLTTLQVDSTRFATLRQALPDEAIAVAESGVRGADDVRALAGLGADAVLVGEAVATAADPCEAVRALVAAGARSQPLDEKAAR